jgi:hypothetical protein
MTVVEVELAGTTFIRRDFSGGSGRVQLFSPRR